MTAVTVERSTGTPVPPPPAPDRGDARTALFAVLPGLAALLIGYYRLDARDIWNDELVTWHVTTLSLSELRMLMGNMDLVHVAYYLIIRALAALTGDSIVALRLPSVIAIALTAVLVTLIGRRLFDTPVGVTAGLLFALLPTVSRYAQEARSYATVTLAAVAATWFFLRALDRSSRGRWWWYAAALVLVGWLHFVALLVLAAHLLYVWRGTGSEQKRWRWALSSAIAMLLVLPLLLLASRQSGQIAWIKGDWTAVQRFAAELTGGLVLLAVVVALGVIGALLAGADRRPAALTLLLWAVLPPVAGYLTYPWLHLFLARYFLFTLPAWALLAAFGAAQLVRVVSRNRVPAAGLVGALLLLPALAYVALPVHREVRSNDADGQPSYLDAVRYLGEQAKPGDGVAYNDGFGGASDIARKAVTYGLRDRSAPRDVFLARSAKESGWLTAAECTNSARCLGDTTRLWLIETEHLADPLVGLPAARAQLLRDRFTVVRVERFDRVRVVLLQRTVKG